MKRIGGLFERLTHRDVLSEAFRRSALGRKAHPDVRSFGFRLDENLERISHQVWNGTYEFGPYQRFRVRDGKSREIHAPPFADRVLHQAMAIVTGPAFEKGATDYSFACRKGLGHRAAIRHARSQVRESSWFCHVDIASYYDSISHRRVHDVLKRRFRERRLLSLFERLLDSYHTQPGLGLPMGALTSQLFGNAFLDSIDHWALDSFRIGRYARYMDDIAAWGDHDTMRKFRVGLTMKLLALGLTAKYGGQLNRCENGMTFLGFTLRPNGLRLHQRGRKRLGSKLSKLHRKFRLGQLDEAGLQSRAQSLFAWASQASDVGWRRSLLARHFDFGDALEDAAGDARRQLRESSRELPVSLSQQEAARP